MPGTFTAAPTDRDASLLVRQAQAAVARRASVLQSDVEQTHSLKWILWLPCSVHTVEALLSALECCGVDNARIEIEGGGELPTLDGSAMVYFHLLPLACLPICNPGARMT